jgi:ribose transport system substrate-binding protein
MSAKKRVWPTVATLGLAVAMATAGCASDNSKGGGSASANEQLGDKAEPSIYCGSECQQQLQLSAAPDSIDCSVGVSWSSASFPYGAKSTTQIPEFAKAFFPNMKVTVSDGRGDATTQADQVADMVAKGIKVLIISPQDATALAGAVDKAKAAGVSVIAADRQVATDVSTYIGSDNVEAGLADGKAVVDALGGKGKVVELSGSLGASPTIDRAKGFRDGIAGSDIEIVASQTADYDRATGVKVTEDLLQRFPKGEVQALYAHNDQMAFGAAQAIKEQGRTEIKIFSIDGEVNALQNVKDGSFAATVGYPLVVKESTLAAAKLCAGEPIDQRIKLDSTLIDADNVDQYIGKEPQ